MFTKIAPLNHLTPLRPRPFVHQLSNNAEQSAVPKPLSLLKATAQKFKSSKRTSFNSKPVKRDFQSSIVNDNKRAFKVELRNRLLARLARLGRVPPSMLMANAMPSYFKPNHQALNKDKPPAAKQQNQAKGSAAKKAKNIINQNEIGGFNENWNNRNDDWDLIQNSFHAGRDVISAGGSIFLPDADVAPNEPWELSFMKEANNNSNSFVNANGSYFENNVNFGLDVDSIFFQQKPYEFDGCFSPMVPPPPPPLCPLDADLIKFLDTNFL